MLRPRPLLLLRPSVLRRAVQLRSRRLSTEPEDGSLWQSSSRRRQLGEAPPPEEDLPSLESAYGSLLKSLPSSSSQPQQRQQRPQQQCL